jgi:hypothetical protein
VREGGDTSVGVAITNNNKELPIGGRDVTVGGRATCPHHDRELQDVADPRGSFLSLRLQESQELIQLSVRREG